MKTRVVSLTEGPLRLWSRSVTTLHIEGGSVRFLVVRGRQVTKWGMERLEPGLLRAGIVADPKAVGERIGSLLAAHRVSKRNLVASVTGQRCVTRQFDFPHLDLRLLKEAVPREMKRELQVPLDEMHLSWQVIRQENGHLRVFALGVPRDVLDPQVQALTLAGGSLHSMDIKPLALVRAVGHREALIADLEQESLDIIVVRSGVPATIRAISLEPDVDATDAKIRRLGEELARSVKFHNDTHQEEPLEPTMPVYLTGSLAEAADSAGITEETMGHPVEPLAPLLEYPADLPVADFMVNIGLALKGR